MAERRSTLARCALGRNESGSWVRVVGAGRGCGRWAAGGGSGTASGLWRVTPRTMVPMTTPRDPLIGTDRLLIDGTNLLHALARRPGAAPPAALIGRLRAAIPASVGIELVLDGAPDRGMRGQRVASGLLIRHSGRRSADALLIDLVTDTRVAAGPTATAGLLVVSDDHDLRTRVRAAGARTTGTAWLIGRLERPRLASPSVGNRRPPKPAVASASASAAASASATRDADDDGRPGWTPGRGATTKRGNPRRTKRSSGRMPT